MSVGDEWKDTVDCGTDWDQVKPGARPAAGLR